MQKQISPEDIQLLVSDSAVRQIQLIKAHDYTLAGKEFRIKIGGKGCDGFTYECGFTDIHPEDLMLKTEFPGIGFTLLILMDQFTAYYTQSASLDYLLNPELNEEGFVVVNASQNEHRGKFFKDPSKLPPWAKA